MLVASSTFHAGFQLPQGGQLAVLMWEGDDSSRVQLEYTLETSEDELQ